MVDQKMLRAFYLGLDDLDKFMKKHVDLKWHCVLLSSQLVSDYETGTEVRQWIQENIQGQIARWTYVWYFECQEDLVVFKLRWI